MSSQELFHSLRNELVVVLGRAELLASGAADQATLEQTLQIKAAALNIRELIQRVQQNHS
jgi:nitrogen-specific signal transduction histidine kinase